MKKTYMQPTMVEQHIELQSMIAASPNGTTVYVEEDAGENVVGLARSSHSVWGDEEEDY